ncbi:hypothetical protein K466DRAFT_587680 [Polyporus arcularius HHB13444]|uniref:Uncharacterized protein n=1 Tax=Polyporus arcularius HHB13444 TaxID=1314778 RepID=A0A5C3PBE2_9APHY|nr:hypothetical protein K466DRAFT_588787 [Polyporus arcularius HHB13444]TFK85958.1 hypothetical protein K466DRAFT_587680 [Polyporus arcularius HHB13444]
MGGRPPHPLPAPPAALSPVASLVRSGCPRPPCARSPVQTASADANEVPVSTVAR